MKTAITAKASSMGRDYNQLSISDSGLILGAENHKIQKQWLIDE